MPGHWNFSNCWCNFDATRYRKGEGMAKKKSKNLKSVNPAEDRSKEKKLSKLKPNKKKSGEKKATVNAVEVVADLARLARLMRSAEHEIGLNPAQWEALRFLSRCNENSNSPIALTRYLGATKGTISQTVIALVNKGLVTKANRKGERRSIALSLTDEGREMLQVDPWKRVEGAFKKKGPRLQARTATMLSRLLDEELEVRDANGLSAWSSAEFFGKVK